MSTFERQLVREAEEFLGITSPAVKSTVTYVKPYVPPVGPVGPRRLGWSIWLAIAGLLAWDACGVALLVLRRLGGNG